MKRLALAIAIASTAASVVRAEEPVELAAFTVLARPAPSVVLTYGERPSQAIELFLPDGPGPFPTVVLIHGGCWRDLPGTGREQLRQLGAVLARQGIASWSIGYRRADEDGSGFPGTFDDVVTAIDRLRTDAARYDLDLTRTAFVGRSAGGHLALWAAARDRLPPESALHRPDPLIPHAVISLGGAGDLEGFARFVPLLCGPGIIEKLAPLAARYAEISPAALAPRGVEIVMVSGTLDRLVPPWAAHDYARAMRQRQGPAVQRVDIPGAGHFDLVTPGRPAWSEVQRLIAAALGRDASTDGFVPGREP